MCCPNPRLQALDAGSSAAIPEGIRQELEKIEDAGGLRFLQDLVAQVKVRLFHSCCMMYYKIVSG